jgi:hypothetical protein
MTPSDAHDNSLGEVDRLFRLSNPVALEDVPEASSPSGEAVYERLLERLAREGEDDPGLGRRFRATWPGLSHRFVAAAIAATAVATAIAFLPGRLADESKLGVVERALAAVSAGPVLHAVVENEDSRAFLVDLASGEETVEPERHEYWYDQERGELRARLTIGTEVVNEVHVPRVSGPPPSHRALAFASRYREALERGNARVVRWETVAGRRAPVLSIDVPAWRDPRSDQVVQPAYTEEVVVDGDTFEPLRFRHLYGPEVASGPVFWWRVVSIESIAHDDDDFNAGPPAFPWTRLAPSNDKEVTLEEAATALGRTALWPGAEVDGVRLERIGVVTTAITWRDGRETKSPSLLIRYDAPGEKGRWLWMEVGTSPATTPRFGPVDGEAVPAGKVRLMEVKAHDDRSIDMWFGNVQRDGIYINMQSPQRELIIEAAKTLKPIG